MSNATFSREFLAKMNSENCSLSSAEVAETCAVGISPSVCLYIRGRSSRYSYQWRRWCSVFSLVGPFFFRSQSTWCHSPEESITIIIIIITSMATTGIGIKTKISRIPEPSLYVLALWVIGGVGEIRLTLSIRNFRQNFKSVSRTEEFSRKRMRFCPKSSVISQGNCFNFELNWRHRIQVWPKTHYGDYGYEIVSGFPRYSAEQGAGRRSPQTMLGTCR